MSSQGTSSQKYGFSKVIPVAFEPAVARVKERLKQEGFGVLAEIDIRRAMKEKLNVEYPSYTILGACNPQLAHRALQAEPRLGLLLPCNVIVREVGGGSEVAVVDAEAMLSLVGIDELRSIAREGAERLQRVLEAV
jgi:uncharacterized protein (DUF302 family)